MLFLTFLLAVTTLSMAPFTAAHAASEVQIDNIEIDSDDGTIEDWSWQRIAVDWSIPERAETPVSLTVDLPEGLYGNAETFPLFGPDEQEAGECVVSRTQITCTIDDDFIEANPYEVAGSFFFEARTEYDNREEVEHTFDIGGFENEVVVRPSRNWCETDCEFGGTGQGKWGSYNTQTDEIIWTVRVPAPATGIEAGQEITVTDLLDEDAYELIDDDTYPRVQEAGLLQYDRWGHEVIGGWQTRTEGLDWSDDRLTVAFDSREGRGADYTAGPPAPAQGSQRGVDGSFYQVQWRTKALTGGELRANGDRVFRNAAEWSIGGEESRSVNGSVTRHHRGGNVVGTNYGKFQVTKELTGDTTLNPEFTVNYTAYLDDEELDSGSFTLRSGETHTSTEYFRGTRVVLHEVLPTDPANVTWATPVFVDAAGEPAHEVEFTVDGNGNLGQVTEIRLKNEATLQKAGFSAQKALLNADGVPVADDLEFSLDYRYPADPDRGFAAGSGTLRLPASGEPVTSGDLPVGAELTLTEANLPNVPGASWGEPVVEPSTLTIGEGSDPVTVTVTNTLTQDLGSFSVTKAVTGDGESLVPEGSVFTVDYEYGAINGFPAGSGQVEVAAGETATVEGIPAGAEVTLTEVAPVDPIGGTWGEPQFDVSTFTVVKDQTVTINLDNPISWNDGDFSVLKEVTGDGAALVSDDAAFTVDYSYVLPEALGADPATGTGTLTVHHDGQAVTSDPLPYGTEVTLTESTPSDVPGGTWLGHEFDQESFTIGDKTTLAVTLTNTIERDLGGFALTKDVTGTGAALIGEDTEFTVSYSYPSGEWYEAGEGTVTVTPGSSASVDELPAGATVTLEEIAPKDPENGSWVAAQFIDGNVVTIGKDEVKKLTLENQIELGAGGFSILKEIEGNGKDLVDSGTVFLIDYEYAAGPGFDAGKGTVEVTADGEAVVVADLPAGAKLQLSERTPADVEGAEWTGHEFSTDTVVIGKSEVVEVTLTNTIGDDDSGLLPQAGAAITALMLLIALGLLVAGGMMFRAARMRQSS
ncbi:DUF5979 domain-containing protein [Aeromicrobium sp. CTD01-1L150]|uniref:DUF5979 domain-containing protein n=1 Tax=Aeromicrobium sp. CTD01-1L150 TaxID=3341830 RepID=UPI0035C035D0